MIEKPIWIQNFSRPSGTEIKFISGHWYLYERKSVYDPVLKKKRKKSGRILGKLTEEGFVASRRNSPLPSSGERFFENREYGATAFLYSLTSDMRERLRNIFGPLWKEIYSLALLKCKEGSPFKRMEFHYQTSFLERLLGPLRLSPGRCTEILRCLGADRAGIRKYMSADLPESGVIMFDGHRIISGSRSLENARLGYDSKCRFLPQVNLLYMFSVSEGKRLPVFYKQFSGDLPDVSAFRDILAESGLPGGGTTVIADKGFESGENEALLEEASLRYIIAVRRGCSAIGEIPLLPTDYQHAFRYRNRAVFCKECRDGKSRLFLYYDLELANDEAVDLIARTEKSNATAELRRQSEEKRRKKGKGRLSDWELEALKPVDVAEKLRGHRANGTFILRTNCDDLNCAEVYRLYKTRQEIEQAFKSYDNELEGKASYMGSQQAFEAWLFINHLALQMFYEVVAKITQADMGDRYSFEDVMKYLSSVRTNLIDGQWITTKVSKQTAKTCQELGIEIQNPETLRTP